MSITLKRLFQTDEFIKLEELWNLRLNSSTHPTPSVLLNKTFLRYNKDSGQGYGKNAQSI